MRNAGAVLLQICPNDTPPFADICRYYEAAARALSWTPVTVMLDTRAPASEPDFHYLRAPFGAALARLVDRRPVVLTLCHRYRAYRVAVASGVVRPPLVTVAHEFGLLWRNQRRWRCRLDRWLGRPVTRFAGVSDAVVDDLQRFSGAALLLPNGIDLARADADRLTPAEARSVLGLSPHEFNIGVVGRLHPKKNPQLAVAGLRRALPRLAGPSGTRLVFVGTGQLEAEVSAAAVDLPVVMRGFVPQANRLMAAFDLLLMPSGEREAFGMVALEAMAAKVPVLCGPSPGPRFVTGDAGLHFPGGDVAGLAAALVQARADHASGTLQQLARRARQRVEKTFSVPAGAARLRELVGC